MNTFEKTRYLCGEDLDILPKNSNPAPRGFYAANALRLTMVATRLAQSGFYSIIEEEQEARKEVDMVHPSHKYGAAVNQSAQPESADLEEAKRCQIMAAKAVRDVSTYGDSSIYSAITNHSTYVKRVAAIKEEPEEPVEVPKIMVPKKVEDTPKEKITSNVAVLGDTGSTWSSVVTGTSLATTTATLTSIVKSQGRPLRQKLNDNLIKHNKAKSVVIDISDMPALEGDTEAADDTEDTPTPGPIRQSLR